MADNPIEAANVWIVTPEQRPHAVAIPSFLPYEMLCAITKILSGPGAIINNKDTPINDK